MKLFKILFILTLLVMNHCISNLSTTGRHRFMSKSSGKKHSSKRGKTGRSHTHSKIHSKAMVKNRSKTGSQSESSAQSNSLSATEFTTKTKTKIINFILGGLSMIMTIAGSVLTYYTKITNMKTLDLMQKEYQMNLEFQDKLTENEINACSTLKLMRQTNKFLFTANEFRLIYLEFYIKIKARNNCQGFEEGEEKSKCLILKSIGSLKKEISKKSPKIMKEIKMMEEKNCNQKSRYDPFAKENEKIQKDIQELQDKIHKEEENLLLGMFGGFVNSVGIEVTQDKNMFLLDTWQIPQGWQFNPQNFNNIAMIVGKSGWAAFRAKELKGKVDKVLSNESNDPNWKNKINIIVGVFNFFSAAVTTIGRVVQGAQLISRVFNFIAKFLEFFVAAIEYYIATHSKTAGPIEKSRARNEFYKRLINMGIALLGIVFNTFMNVLTEGLQLVRKTVALIEAKDHLKAQTQRNKFFEKLGKMEVSAAENLKIYSVCKANYLSIKSYYEIFNEIALTETTMLNKYNEEKLTILWNDIMENDSSTHEVMIEFREKIKKICAKNVQFCSRNFERKNLEEWLREEKHTIDKLAERAIYGPYTDLIVTQTKEEFLAFIQLGYEPIYNTHKSYVLGCRMCNNKRVIRFFTVGKNHVSRDGSDLSKVMFEKTPGTCNSSSPFPCSSLFDDSNCEGIYESTRLDNGKVLIFEKVPFTVYDSATNERVPIPYVRALAKIFTMDPQKSLNFFPRYGIWKNYESSWKSCNTQDSALKPFCPSCAQKILTIDDDEVKISKKKYIGFSVSEKNVEEDQVLISIPFERELSSHVGGELRYPEKRLYFKAFKIPEANDFLSHHSIAIEENVDNTQNGFYQVSSHFYIRNKRNPDRIQNTPQFYVYPGAYNWLINDELFTTSALSKENLNKISKAIEAQEFVINRNEDTDVADIMAGNISTDVFTYILITFKPFSPNSNMNFENESQDSKRLCENICKPDSSELAVRKQTCNFIDDLSYNNYIFNREEMTVKRSGESSYLLSHYYIAKNLEDYDDIDDSVDFKDLSIYDNLEYNNLKIFHGNFSKLNGKRLCFIKDYEKEIIKRLKIGSCNHKENEIVEGPNGRDYINFKRKDFHDDIIVIFLNGDKKKKDRVKDAVYALNGYFLLDKFSGKFVDTSHSVYVFIKPLPSSGFAPFNENYKRWMWSADDGCRDDFLGSLQGKLCFTQKFSEVTYTKESHKKCVVPDGQLANYDLYNENLFKVSKIKDVEKYKEMSLVNNPSYLIKDMLHQLDKDNKVRSLKCKEADFFIPVKFHEIKISDREDDESYSKNKSSIESKDKYRAIEIEGDGEQTKIVEKYVDAGPGIRSIYWLQFTLSTKNSNNKKDLNENMDIAEKWGYVLHHTIQEIKLFHNQLFNINVWVAFDYRLGVKRSELCTLCSENINQEKPEDYPITSVERPPRPRSHRGVFKPLNEISTGDDDDPINVSKPVLNQVPQTLSGLKRKYDNKLRMTRQDTRNLD